MPARTTTFTVGFESANGTHHSRALGVVEKRHKACKTAEMRNNTVSVDDDVYRSTRIHTAERGTSVSALVRAFLVSVAGEETDFARRKRMEQEALATISGFSASDRVSREDVHDRSALR